MLRRLAGLRGLRPLRPEWGSEGAVRSALQFWDPSVQTMLPAEMQLLNRWMFQTARCF